MVAAAASISTRAPALLPARSSTHKATSTMQDSATLLHSTPVRPTSCCFACARMSAGLVWPNTRAVSTRNTIAPASKPSSMARLGDRPMAYRPPATASNRPAHSIRRRCAWKNGRRSTEGEPGPASSSLSGGGMAGSYLRQEP
ncbi:hypothetical protein D3C71_1711740 [compost metagenome]